MARGYQKNKEHQEKVALLGKSLIRRCNKKCELCEAAGQGLKVIEVEPVPETPPEDHALMLCQFCRRMVEAQDIDPAQARFLESVIWSEIPAVQVTAVRMCRKLAAKGVDWAAQVLDTVYLNPEVEVWLKSKA